MKCKESFSFKLLFQTGINLTEWLAEQPAYNEDAPGISEASQVSDLKLYKVL